MTKEQLRAQLDTYFEEHSADFIETICRLIRIESARSEALPDMPYGAGPAAALAEAMKIAQEFGFATKNYENYVGAVDYNTAETQLDILAHLDCVPVGDDWTVTTPFAPVVKDGKIYGRGTVDDKGPAICALYAMKALKDMGIELPKNVRLILGTDEESGSSDIRHYYATEKEAPMTFSPDADYPLINIEKGGIRGATFTKNWEKETATPRLTALNAGDRTNVVPDTAVATIIGMDAAQAAPAIAKISGETGVTFAAFETGEALEITAAGMAGHASTPERGNNAITAILALLAELPLADGAVKTAVQNAAKLFPHGELHGAGLGVDLHDEESGWLTLSLDVIKLDEEGMSATFDCRAPICATDENLLFAARDNLATAGFKLSDDARRYEPHHVPADSPFVQTLLNCYKDYTGDMDAKPLAIGGGTYVHNLQNGVAFGIQTLGTDYHMHGADEFAIIDELLMSAKLFASVIVELCG